MISLTADKKKTFCPEKYLTSVQVISYFSRMKKEAKYFDAEDENEEDESFICYN